MYQRFIIIGCLSALLGCGHPQDLLRPVPLPAQAQQQPLTARVIIGGGSASDRELVGQHDNGANQAGLAGAITHIVIARHVNSGIQERQKLMTAIRGAEIRFNFGSRMRAALTAEMRQLTWLKATVLTKTPVLQTFDLESLVQRTQADTLLAIEYRYAMAEDFSKLSAQAYVTLYPTTAKLRKLSPDKDNNNDQPILYRNRLAFDYPFEGDSTDAATAARAWAADDGAMVTRALNEAVSRLSSYLVNDLQKPAGQIAGVGVP